MGFSESFKAALYGDSAEWRQRAACRGLAVDNPNMFFPGRGSGRPEALLASACEGCAVQNECREYAVADSTISGFWGGTTDKERRRIRHQRLIATNTATGNEVQAA